MLSPFVPEMETGTNRGLRGSLFGRSGVGLQAGIPALKPIFYSGTVTSFIGLGCDIFLD
jgi:hypothetical protein